MSVYTITGLRHIYAGRTVLNLPRLDIERGEILAVVGPSGAGKSTLLRLLGLLEAPSTGAVALTLDGGSANSLTATVSQRRRLVMVFQRPVLLSMNVRENIAFGLRLRGLRSSRAVDDMMARLSLSHLADARPRTLSGGEMQRVAIARALILQPDVLLLDEPTANLDPHNVSLVEQFVRDEYRRYAPTIVLVTHNIYQARRLATRVALLLDGELVEDALPETFFDHPNDPRTQAFVSGTLVY